MNAESNLRVAAHPMHAEAPFLTLLAASPTISAIVRSVDALAFAASLRVPALFPTRPTVEPVRHHIHALLLAAVLSCASLSPAHCRVLIACHFDPAGLRQKTAAAPKGYQLLAFIFMFGFGISINPHDALVLV